jgi:DNA-binding transcriptional MerR regulator
MLISELAQAVGLHPETIRRLERRGLIRSARDHNGWRHFSVDTIEKLKKLYGEGQTDDDGPESNCAA